MTSTDSPDPSANSEPDAPRAPDAFEKLRASWGFPAFARDFPNDPELATLVAAFAAGDHAAVRAGAPALAAKTEDPEVKRAAELLRARIEPDPTARIFFALTAALLVFLLVWWVSHDGKQHAQSPVKMTPAMEPAK